MRVAITGASGLLGRELIAPLVGAGHHVIATVHRAAPAALDAVEQYALDLLDRDSITRFTRSVQADWIIHAAANADVDQCEREPELAHALNAEATVALMESVRGTGTRVLYVSTDYVFDGEAGPYEEAAPADPINVYGRSKLLGEQAVLDEGRHVVVRSASFLGIGPPGHPSFAERMAAHLQQSPPLAASTNRMSNVTPIDYLARGIVALMRPESTGIYHVVSREIISRHDLALRLAKLLHLPEESVTDIVPTPRSSVAPRPLQGGLISTRETLAPPSLDEALQRFVDDLAAR